MLGEFTLREEGTPAKKATVANLTGRSRRLWILLAYLIANRDRGVSSEELIDLLWPDASNENPLSTLQNNVSRLRSMLAEAGFSDAKTLVRSEKGAYRWAPGRETVLDADIFEGYARRYDKHLEESELDRAIDACELYRGDYLFQATGEAWCVSLGIYYRSLFTRLCRKTLHALLLVGRTEDVERVCLRAIDIDPSAEEFSIFLMHALTAGGNPQKALDHYDHIKHVFENTYGVSVSSELEMERERAVHALYGHAMDEEAIRAFLSEDAADEGAFFCSNTVFREIVQLHVREHRRSQMPSQLATISFATMERGSEKRAVNVKRLEHTLSIALRAGDPFTKVGSEQFLILLPGASSENGDMIMQRVTKAFHKTYPRVLVEFRSAVFDISSFEAR